LEQKYLHFQVEGMSFAIPIEFVKEIVPMPTKLTKIPNNTTLLGITNVRGQIVPVIDFKEQFQLCKTEQPRKLLIVENGKLFGIPVDNLSGVVVAKENEIDNFLGFNLFFNDETVKGILKKDDLLIAVIDITKLNTNKTLQKQEELC